MKIGKIFDYLFNPAVGIIPIVIFLTLQFFLPYQTSLFIGIAVYFLFLTASLMFQKDIPPFMLLLIGVVFSVFLFLTKFTPLREMPEIGLSIIFEALFVILTWIFSLFYPFVRGKAVQKDRNNNSVFLIRFDEFVFITKLLQRLVIFHILVAIFYKMFPSSYQSPELDRLIFFKLIFGIVIAVIVFEYIRVIVFRSKIKKEDWLPVVNESGKVIGKVAFSISRTSENLFLHPVVRVALIYKGLLYLMNRPSHYLMNPDKIDYPFEEYVKFSKTLDETNRDIIFRRAGVKDLNVRFVFRYLFKNDITHRLIYLYTINIQSEEIMNSLNFEGGKLWTEKQIEENLDTGIFSEFFEKEYDILKNTVLMAEHLIHGDVSLSSNS